MESIKKYVIRSKHIKRETIASNAYIYVFKFEKFIDAIQHVVKIPDTMIREVMWEDWNFRFQRTYLEAAVWKRGRDQENCEGRVNLKSHSTYPGQQF